MSSRARSTDTRLRFTGIAESFSNCINNCRAAHAVTNWVAIHRVRSARSIHTFVYSFLKFRICSEASMANGEMHPSETHVELCAEEVNN